jgi:predicted DNA-binding WGR domain protein
MIMLTRSESSRNMHRFYALHLAPTLFGEWALVAEWGRIGSPGTIKQQIFEDEGIANAALTHRLTAKTRRGYIGQAVTLP